MKTINGILGFARLEKTRLEKQMLQMREKGPDLIFGRSDYTDVFAFFNEANKDYDSDLRNPYWSFTHEILKFILVKFISDHFRPNQEISLFDAGAGTGNWSNFVLSLNPRIKAILFDMNSNMLKMAYPKILHLNGNSVKMIEGNLELLRDFPQEPSNLILCMHNVIGLARNTERVLINLCSYLEQGGLAFIMAPNKYHAFNFTNTLINQFEVQRVLRDGSVKFKADMPEMFCYTPEEFESMLYQAGFREVKVLGFPVTVYPSQNDTKLLEKDTSDLQLKNTKTRAALLELEKRLCLLPELAYRGGSSLLAICKK